MLDPKTLRVIEPWLEKKFKAVMDEAERTQSSTLTLPLVQSVFDDMLREYRGKAEAIEKEIERVGVTAQLIPGKKTKTRHDFSCPTCGARKSVLRIYFSEPHVKLLRKIFVHCVERRTHFIHTTDVKGITHAEYSFFAKLQNFGFLYYPEAKDEKRKKNGDWGVAVKRIYEFLNGSWAVAEYTEHDTITKEKKVSEKRILVGQVRKKKGGSQAEREKAFHEREAVLPYFVEYVKLQDLPDPIF